MAVLLALLFGLLAPQLEKRAPEENLTQMIPYDDFELAYWFRDGNRPDCGKYFLYSGLPSEDRMEVVSFKFGGYNQQDGRWMSLPTILIATRLNVRVVEGKDRPRARRINLNDPTASLYEVQISQSDFDKAPCLKRARRVTYE